MALPLLICVHIWIRKRIPGLGPWEEKPWTWRDHHWHVRGDPAKSRRRSLFSKHHSFSFGNEQRVSQVLFLFFMCLNIHFPGWNLLIFIQIQLPLVVLCNRFFFQRIKFRVLSLFQNISLSFTGQFPHTWMIPWPVLYWVQELCSLSQHCPSTLFLDHTLIIIPLTLQLFWFCTCLLAFPPGTR